MTANTYGTIMKIVAFALAAAIAAAIVLELPLYVPVLAVVAALIITSFLRRRVTEIMADERDRRIQEQAMSAGYRAFTISGAALALIAMMLRSRLPEWAYVAGQTLAYAVLGLMLLQAVFAWYYRRKL